MIRGGFRLSPKATMLSRTTSPATGSARFTGVVFRPMPPTVAAFARCPSRSASGAEPATGTPRPESYRERIRDVTHPPSMAVFDAPGRRARFPAKGRPIATRRAPEADRKGVTTPYPQVTKTSWIRSEVYGCQVVTSVKLSLAQAPLGDLSPDECPGREACRRRCPDQRGSRLVDADRPVGCTPRHHPSGAGHGDLEPEMLAVTIFCGRYLAPDRPRSTGCIPAPDARLSWNRHRPLAAPARPGRRRVPRAATFRAGP